MDEFEKTLADLEKVKGAEELAKALRKQVTEAFDTVRGEANTAKKDAASFKKTADAYKRDLDAAGATKEEALKGAQKERDDWKGKAEQAERVAAGARRRTAVADELGISDPERRRHATNAFLAELPEDVTLDDNGRLVGAAKHIKSFREKAGFYWDAAEAAAIKVDAGNGGPRQGGEKPPTKTAGAGSKAEPTRNEKVKSWDSELYPQPQGAAKA